MTSRSTQLALLLALAALVCGCAAVFVVLRVLVTVLGG